MGDIPKSTSSVYYCKPVINPSLNLSFPSGRLPIHLSGKYKKPPTSDWQYKVTNPVKHTPWTWIEQTYNENDGFVNTFDFCEISQLKH